VPAWIVDLFARYGYAVVFFGTLLENAGLPVPGETALIAGAALAKSGHLSLAWVIVTAVCGAILGDNIGFAIGRRGGRALAERHGAKIGLTRARLHQFDRFFERHGAQTVFIARFVTGLRVVCAFLAGASDLEWRTFLFYNATGAIVWATTFGFVGYSLAYSWDKLERWIGTSGLFALAAIILLGFVAALRNRRAKTS
jgi:membrane protein DedA with SNARE-associated domain